MGKRLRGRDTNCHTKQTPSLRFNTLHAHWSLQTTAHRTTLLQGVLYMVFYDYLISIQTWLIVLNGVLKLKFLFFRHTCMPLSCQSIKQISCEKGWFLSKKPYFRILFLDQITFHDQFVQETKKLQTTKQQTKKIHACNTLKISWNTGMFLLVFEKNGCQVLEYRVSV